MNGKISAVVCLLFVSFIAVGCAGGKNVKSDESSVGPNRWYTEAGMAVQGYDAVAYFTEREPVEGDVAFHYKWDGVTWLFSSSEHREMFKEEPEKYAPQYGGYCSLAVAYGKKSAGSAEAWTVRDEKLYLNYDKEVRKNWLENPAKYIRMADRQWPRIKDD